jgi:hypothetical protein
MMRCDLVWWNWLTGVGKTHHVYDFPPGLWHHWDLEPIFSPKSSTPGTTSLLSSCHLIEVQLAFHVNLLEATSELVWSN